MGYLPIRFCCLNFLPVQNLYLRIFAIIPRLARTPIWHRKRFGALAQNWNKASFEGFLNTGIIPDRDLLMSRLRNISLRLNLIAGKRFLKSFFPYPRIISIFANMD